MGNQNKHVGVMCTKCKLVNLPYIRYKCIICPGFSLCSNCHYDQPEFNNHKKNHAMLVCQKPLSKQQEDTVNLLALTSGLGVAHMLKQQKSIQNNRQCCGCKQNPFYGIKLQCDICQKMYMCWDCYKNQDYGAFESIHKKDHPILAFLFHENINISQDIQTVQQMGKNPFSKFTKVRRTSTGKIYTLKTTALKFKDKKQTQLQTNIFNNQLETYQNLIDANIVAYKGVNVSMGITMQLQFELRLQILLEHMPKGNLLEVLGKQDLSNIKKLSIVINILSGLKKIHRKGYVHRDLKPESIFIDSDYTAKLGDLGLSGQQMMQGIAGTILWLPAQVYKLIQLKVGVLIEMLSPLINTKAADIFTIGLIINYIFTEKLHKRTPDGNVVFQKNSPYFFNIIKTCLLLKAGDRPTADNLYNGFEAMKIILEGAVKMCDGEIDDLSIKDQNQLFDVLYKKLGI